MWDAQTKMLNRRRRLGRATLSGRQEAQNVVQFPLKSTLHISHFPLKYCAENLMRSQDLPNYGDFFCMIMRNVCVCVCMLVK